jgi:uncharacterized protein
MADVRVILHAHVDDYLTEADRYQSLGHSDAAQRLRREATPCVAICSPRFA